MENVEDLSILVALSEKIKRDLDTRFDNLVEELRDAPIEVLGEAEGTIQVHRGPPGVRGERGYAGRKGEKGDRGVNGHQGVAGPAGSQGERGYIGPIGPAGPQGNAGPQGIPGKDGAPGKDANPIDLEAVLKDLNSRFNKLQALMINKVNTVVVGHSGGGSANILDNDDVVYTRIADITADSVLIFDAARKKFVPQSMVDIINRIKVDLEMQYTRLIDTDGVYTYIGEALPGTLLSAPLWRIKRVEALVGQDINIVWSDGSSDFNKVWDNRASYGYS